MPVPASIFSTWPTGFSTTCGTIIVCLGNSKGKSFRRAIPKYIDKTSFNNSISVWKFYFILQNCLISDWLQVRMMLRKRHLPPPRSHYTWDKLKDLVMYEGKNIHFSAVDNKALCSYSGKLCKQRRLNGYAFCLRHILEDPSAPFKQCTHSVKNRQQCLNPVPRSSQTE